MLKIKISSNELYDEHTCEFVSIPEQTLEFEHSLVSISEWESRWCKPFLSENEKTEEETMDYIRCMCLTPDVDDYVFTYMSADNILKIKKYIDSPMTASTVNDTDSSGESGEFITSELIYYWMSEHQIDFSCETWHLNRLLMLIKICNAKRRPPRKRSMSEIVAHHRTINEQRRKAMKTMKG